MSLDPTSSVAGLNNLSYLNQENEIKSITIKSPRSPTPNDRRYKIGTFWINQNINAVWILTSVVAGQANWEPLSSNVGGNAPITKYVVAQDGSGDYTTIQAALNVLIALGDAEIIYIKPGVYNENLNFYPIDTVLVGSQEVTISGTHVPSPAAAVYIQDIGLDSSGSIFSTSSSGNGPIFLLNCFIKNINGYLINLPNWGSRVTISNTIFEGTVTQDGIINNSGNMTVKIYDSILGGGSSFTFTANGTVNIYNSVIDAAINVAGSNTFLVRNSLFKKNATIGSATKFESYQSTFSTGSTQAITYNSSSSLSQISDTTIDSANDPAIGGTGTGTLTLAGINFLQNSNISSSLTIQSGTIKGGNFITQYVVDSIGESGAYKTIQAAVNAAAALGGGTIYVKKGIYTENLILYPDVHLVGASGSAFLETVKIIGRHILPFSGKISFKNLFFEATLTEIFLSTVPSIADLSCTHCEFSMGALTGRTFNISAAFGSLEIRDCVAQAANDGFLFYNGGSDVLLKDSKLGGVGSSQLLDVLTASSLEVFNCEIGCIFNTAANFKIDGGCAFKEGVITAVTASGSIFNSSIVRASGSAYSHLTSGTVELSDLIIDTPTSPAISVTGGGALSIGTLTFLNNSNISAAAALVEKETVSGIFRTVFVPQHLEVFRNELTAKGSNTDIPIKITTKGIGDVEVTNGNVSIETVGKGLEVKEGTNARMGVTTLSAGTSVVSTTEVTANSRIFVTNQLSSGTIGFLYISGRTPGVGFTILSSSVTDTSTVAWMIVEPS